MDIPVEGLYLWNWYFNLTDMFKRVREERCVPVPPSEYLAWAEMTGTIVYPHEYDILKAMDAAYCAEMNKELRDFQTRREEKRKRDIEEASKKGKRK